MEDQIYYKAVTKKLKSVVVNSVDKNCIQYAINQWVYPKIATAPLFVFDKIESATKFASGHPEGYEIYACHIKKAAHQEITNILNIYQLDYVNAIDLFWEERNRIDPIPVNPKNIFSRSVLNIYKIQMLPIVPDGICPPGTVFADAVKLLGKVA